MTAPNELAARTVLAALTDEQRAWIDGLRELADFLEARPDLLNPIGVTVYRWVGTGGEDTAAEDVKSEVARLARMLGTASKEVEGNWFNLNRWFGPHTLQITARRDDVCERVVTGTTTVEVPDPAAVAALPKVTVEQDVVEWVCPPSLLRPVSAVAEHTS